MLSFSGGETNSWLRNVYFKNCNRAITVDGRLTRQISILDIVIDDFFFRPYRQVSGHMGIYLGNGPKYNLLHNILFLCQYVHTVCPMGTQYNTFSRITGSFLILDHHAMGNQWNLYTEVDAGLGGRGFGGLRNNRFETYWGIKESSQTVTCQPNSNVSWSESQPTNRRVSEIPGITKPWTRMHSYHPIFTWPKWPRKRANGSPRTLNWPRRRLHRTRHSSCCP